MNKLKSAFNKIANSRFTPLLIFDALSLTALYFFVAIQTGHVQINDPYNTTIPALGVFGIAGSILGPGITALGYHHIRSLDVDGGKDKEKREKKYTKTSYHNCPIQN